MSLFASVIWATDEGAFQAAIRAAPDDDTLRLVYADWLTEHDDPRGEFIRLQIALEHEPFGPNRAAMERREIQLLHANAEKWAPGPGKKYFRRGLVDSIGIDSWVLEQRGVMERVLAGHAGVREIDLEVTRLPPTEEWIEHWRAFADSPFVSIRCLSVQENRGYNPHAVWNGIFPALTTAKVLKLRCLIGQYCSIPEESFGQYVSSENARDLTSLMIGFSSALAERVATSEKVARFDHLLLYDYSGHGGPGGISSLERLLRSSKAKSLRSLGFRNVYGTLDEIVALIDRFGIKGLESLTLWGSRPEPVVTDATLRTIAGSETFSRLKELAFPQTHFTVEALRDFGRATHLRHLTQLSFRGRVGDEGVRAISEWKNFPSLRALDLDSAGITDRGAQFLASSPHLTHLTKLELPRNQITSLGLKALAESPNFARLGVLNLRQNPIADVKVLLGANQLGQLVFLDLSDSLVRDVVHQGLLETPSMSHLATVLGGGTWPATGVIRRPEENECASLLEDLDRKKIYLRDLRP